jgi:hypothetical protein
MASRVLVNSFTRAVAVQPLLQGPRLVRSYLKIQPNVDLSSKENITKHFSQGQRRALSSSSSAKTAHQSQIPLQSCLYVLYGVPLTLGVFAGGLYVYYRPHFENVLITNRERMLWFESEDDENVSYHEMLWLMSQSSKPLVGKDHLVAQMAQKILDRLLQTNLTKGASLELQVLAIL